MKIIDMNDKIKIRNILEDFRDTNISFEEAEVRLFEMMKIETTPNISFEQFKAEWLEIRKSDPEFIREGQSLMNFLAAIWMSEYVRITGNADIDCYYRDSLIPNTLIHLEQQWKNF